MIPPPGVDVLAVGLGGPVHQVEVHILQTETLHAGPDRVLRGLETLILGGELGGDEQFVTGNARRGDGAPDCLFIALVGVDQPVPDLQGAGHRALGLRGGQLGDAEAQNRENVVVVERDGGGIAAAGIMSPVCGVEVSRGGQNPSQSATGQPTSGDDSTHGDMSSEQARRAAAEK